MAILFISHKYPPSTGGMEKFSYELIGGISKKTTVYKIVYTGGESKVLWFYRLRRRVKNLLEIHPEINVIHLNDGLMAFMGRWIKKQYNLPVVVTLHGLDIVFPLAYFQHTIIPTLNVYDLFICVSEATRLAAIERGIAPAKTRVIQNGVDHALSESLADKDVQQKLRDRYHLEEGKQIMIGLGRSVKRKGYSWFVKEVLPGLPPDLVFILCGPSSGYNGAQWRRFLPDRFMENIELMLGLSTDEKALQDLAKKSPDRFIKTGYLPFNEIMQLMLMSGIFIMPNIKVEGDMEGFGLVALEACLAGCIVYASAIDGITNAIINEKNGYLLPAQNAPAWIDALHQELKRGDRSERVQHFKKYTLENYGWDKMCDDYLGCAEKVK
jgi:glycosyltransferase involved in cell wall biosynthesis